MLTDTRSDRVTLVSMLTTVLGHKGGEDAVPKPEIFELSLQITIWQDEKRRGLRERVSVSIPRHGRCMPC